ncbi:MAG: dicarboxylate/amino acid:cation symporter [Phycisphaerales bacterium]|nr:dicarboxylate/amino acid:cation symporter [Phycisphaerales bacterium]
MRLALHWQILIGLALGLCAGLVLNRYGPAVREVAGDGLGAGVIDSVVRLNWLLGELFKRSLQFIAVPIIVLALILALGSLGDPKALGRVGLRTIAIFACTAFISVGLGLTLVNLIKPGSDRFISPEAREALLRETARPDAADMSSRAGKISGWDLVRDAMPTNPVRAMAEGDMIQVVVFTLMLGIGLSLLPRERTRPLYEALDALNEGFIMIVRGIMRTAPVGVFCLLVPIAATLGFHVLKSLGAYCLTVLLGLALIQFVLYPLVVKVFSPIPLRRFFRGIAQVQMVAFSSSSSAATLPVTIQNVRDRLGVPGDITGFVCAMGAKINMDGTALMQAVATVFLAQFYGMDLPLPAQASIVFTAVLSAIGTPGIPSGGMVMLIVVLRSVGVPAEGIALILAVDRVLDMCRTVVNVTGDAAVAVAVAGRSGTEQKM